MFIANYYVLLAEIAYGSCDRESCPEILLHGMACCHAVSLLGTEVVGLGVEVEMLRATGWELAEAAGALPAVREPSSGAMIELVRRFDFDHTRMTSKSVGSEPAHHRSSDVGVGWLLGSVCGFCFHEEANPIPRRHSQAKQITM